jgi:sulfide:quinone oxidoreductase
MPRSRRGPIILVMPPIHVLVAGGGFAAAEALLALRDLAGDSVRLELLTPDLTLPLKPASTSLAEVPTYDLRTLAGSVGARVREDRLEAVAPAVRRVRLASGGFASYDALVLAVGARPRLGVPGAVTFRDQRDGPLITSTVAEARRLVIAVPAGVSWSLPAYELALRAAETTSVTLVTPEQAPLEVFGPRASAAVASRLDHHAVRFVGGARPRDATPDGLRLAFGGDVAADRVIALPALGGRRIAGVPAAFGGFVPTDASGRVDDLDHVWAIGDMTAFPLKQGGLATQQADLAAADIAGEPVPDPLFVLRARLQTPGGPLYLRTELDASGRPLDSEAIVATEPPWWPGAKVVGRHLTPWMADQALLHA